jgi:hypothetical protein
MIKAALEDAARRQTQSNANRNYSLSKDRFDFEKNKKTPQERISARVSELVGQGVPLIEASKQTRLEVGETNPIQYGTDEYIKGAVAVTKAREAAKPPRPARGATSDPNSPVKASQRERYFSQIADRAMEAAGGDVNKAGAVLLQQPETASIFTQGLNASHLNAAAARYRLRRMGRGGSSAPTSRGTQSPQGRGALSDLVTPTATKAQRPAPSRQQQDWDEAATALRQRGDHSPEATLGQRPSR